MVLCSLLSFALVQPISKAKSFCLVAKYIVEIDNPHSVLTYNHHMGGVELIDSFAALYHHS